MKQIERIKLQNFKRFSTFEVEFDKNINIIIGDNEAGKSTILQAIDIALSGSRNKIETIGIENLFSNNAVNNFMTSQKNQNDLPTLFIELYFNEVNNYELCGKHNSENIDCNGLKLAIKPDPNLSEEIKNVLTSPTASFPFEFYTIEFKTFDGRSYSGYKKYLKSIFIDNSQGNSEYAMREYIKDIYEAKLSDIDRRNNQFQYRDLRKNYEDNILVSYNSILSPYNLSLKNSPKLSIEANLTIRKDSISVENKGKGEQCFIKTELAIQKSEKDIDVVLMEEPENHLSHTNMHKLIMMLDKSLDKQLIFSTHNNLITTRLGLQNAILINNSSDKPIKLKDIPAETADFFIKAPNNNLLQMILSKKVLLVEGNAEYILMEKIYNIVTNEELTGSDIHVISVGGLSFKRYLEIAQRLNIKTAVITDNDGDYDNNITEKYKVYNSDNIAIFSDKNNQLKTFEICIYRKNNELCDKIFSSVQRTLSIEDYMLKNKTEAAYQLAIQSKNLTVPKYIQDAIKWIKD